MWWPIFVEIRELEQSLDGKQKNIIKDLKSKNLDEITTVFGTLGIALGKDLDHFDNEEIMDFFKVNNYDNLRLHDILLVRILYSLRKYNDNIIEEFYQSFSSPENHPEILYLINQVKNVLKKRP